MSEADRRKKDHEALEQFHKDLVKAQYAEDMQFCLDAYTDDAIFLAPDVGWGKGKEALRKAWKIFFSRKYDKQEYNKTELFLGDDHCTAMGTYEISVKGKGIKGWWFSTLVKQDGKWKLKYDMTTCGNMCELK